MTIKNDIQLFTLTRQNGNFPVWVKDEEGNTYTGGSFDLSLSFASGSCQVFPCIDEEGDSHQLHPEQIADYGML